jgi:hypothetical protein
MSHAPTVRKPDPSRLPPELLGSLPRDVRLTGGGIAVTAIAIALVVGALVVTIIMSLAYMRAEADRRLREREAITANAEVVRVAVVRNQRTRFDVDYRYEVDGRAYTGRTRLRQQARPFENGAAISIRYLQSRPETSWLPGRERRFPLWAIPLATVSLLLVASAVAWSVRRQWILLSEGRGAQARVTAAKKVSSDHGKWYRVSYEFRTINGATQTSRCNMTKAAPAVGTVMPIVYHRDKPYWSAAYPLEMVRPGRLVK